MNEEGNEYQPQPIDHDQWPSETVGPLAINLLTKFGDNLVTDNDTGSPSWKRLPDITNEPMTGRNNVDVRITTRNTGSGQHGMSEHVMFARSNPTGYEEITISASEDRTGDTSAGTIRVDRFTPNGDLIKDQSFINDQHAYDAAVTLIQDLVEE